MRYIANNISPVSNNIYTKYINYLRDRTPDVTAAMDVASAERAQMHYSWYNITESYRKSNGSTSYMGEIVFKFFHELTSANIFCFNQNITVVDL